MCMRKILKVENLFIAFGILSLWLSSCSKSDSPYYSYENTVQVYKGTAFQYLKDQPSGTFDSLLLILDRYPALEDSLSKEQLTVFAPVNKNFESAIKYLNIKRKVMGLDPVYLSTANGEQLQIMLCKYFIRGNRTTDSYINDSDGILVKSIMGNYPMHVKYEKMSSSGYIEGGASTLRFSDTFGSSFSKDWVRTKANTVNIRTDNATINILESIHNFGFDEFTDRLSIDFENNLEN